LEGFKYYKYQTYKHLKFIFKDLVEIIRTLESINLSRGYVISVDIFSYPIISEAALKFVRKEE
jgi:hypothetical protein